MTIVKSRGTEPVRLRTPFEFLSKEAQEKLRELMVSLDPLGKLVAQARNSARWREAGERSVPVKNKNQSARRDLRLPKPGDVLRRHYQGREIVVRVLESGFEYEGHRFRSLSAIAKIITGAHWNGLLFFQIVRQER